MNCELSMASLQFDQSGQIKKYARSKQTNNADSYFLLNQAFHSRRILAAEHETQL